MCLRLLFEIPRRLAQIKTPTHLGLFPRFHCTQFLSHLEHCLLFEPPGGGGEGGSGVVCCLDISYLHRKTFFLFINRKLYKFGRGEGNLCDISGICIDLSALGIQMLHLIRTKKGR